jgi:hypothetical protein
MLSAVAPSVAKPRTCELNGYCVAPLIRQVTMVADASKSAQIDRTFLVLNGQAVSESYPVRG